MPVNRVLALYLRHGAGGGHLLRRDHAGAAGAVPGDHAGGCHPCPSQPEGWTPEQQARWQALVERCDYETVVQDHYSAGCMQRRNRYMVDHAQRLIAVFDGQEGGTTPHGGIRHAPGAETYVGYERLTAGGLPLPLMFICK